MKLLRATCDEVAESDEVTESDGQVTSCQVMIDKSQVDKSQVESNEVAESDEVAVSDLR
jgi:hypothetical protein